MKQMTRPRQTVLDRNLRESPNHILFRMLNVRILKDPVNALECQQRWPGHSRQPYYNLEQNFTHKKGSTGENILLIRPGILN